MRSQEAANVRVRRWFPAVLALAILAGGGCEKKRRYRPEDMCWPAREGNLQEVRSRIARGISVHAADYQGRTPLHHAGERGHIEVATLLIRSGAQVDSRDKGGLTPVALAMSQNHREMVECLVGLGAAVDLHLAAYLGDAGKVRGFLDSGADVNAKGPDGWTPLLYAVLQNQREAARLLIAAGAGLNAVRKGKYLPAGYRSGVVLHLAAAEGHFDLVELLIDAGADVEIHDAFVETALYAAVRNGRSDIVELLMAKGANPNTSSRADCLCDNVPLGIAVREGYVDVAEALIAGGANVNARDDFGWTPLHVAVTSYYESAVDAAMTMARPPRTDAGEKWDRYAAAHDEIHAALMMRMTALLVDRGADVNAGDESGITSLHRVVYWSYKNVVEFLLTEGADVNARTGAVRERPYIAWGPEYGWCIGSGVTPLHQAVASGDPNVVNALIAHGADVNVLDESGRTPLHHAGARTNADIVGLLAVTGADVDVQDELGATPLIEALVHGHVAVAKRLLAVGAERVILKDYADRVEGDASLLLHKALGNMQKEWVLVRRGAGEDLVPRDRDGGEDRQAWVRLLLANGVDLDERDGKGNTPLQAAILAGDEASARLLIAHGADIKSQNHPGSTALHHASSDGRKDLVFLLLAKGAEENAQDNDGDTPLHSAALRGHREIVELLLAHGADSRIRNSRGRTPRDEALRRGHGEIAGLLAAARIEGVDAGVRRGDNGDRK